MIDSRHKNQFKVTIEYFDQETNVVAGHEQSLLDTLVDADIEINHSCGGFGTCGTCLVRVQEGLTNINQRNEIESEMAQARNFTEQERLACQCELSGPIKIQIPE